MNKAILLLAILSLLLIALLLTDGSDRQNEQKSTRLQDQLKYTYSQVAELVLTQGSATFRFKKSSSENENTMLAKQGLWQEASLGRALREELRLDILQWFEKASFYRLGKVNEIDLSSFGLSEKDSIKIEIGSEGKTDSCFIGMKVPEREARYVYCTNSEWYGYAQTAWTEALFENIHAWMETKIFRIPSQELQRMLFSSLQGSVVLIEREGKEWKVQGKAADLRFLETFMEGVLALEAESRPMHADIPISAPAFQTLALQNTKGETTQAKVYLFSGESPLAGLKISGDEQTIYPIKVLKLRGLLPSAEGLQGEEKVTPTQQ